MPKVFIIILHYHSVEDTKECLRSLEKLNYDNFEVVLINNGAKDDLNSQFTRLALNSKIRIINNKENLGFAGGNNVGIKYALECGASYILLLNNDTIIEPNFLKELIKAGENDERIGILGPIIYEYNEQRTMDKEQTHFAGGKINWLYTKGKHILNRSYEIRDTDYITGACMLIKRKVIEKIGLMPEDYFLYLEDVDWCLKARRAGFKCVVVFRSKIWHKVSQSAVEASFSYIYYHFRNGLLLTKRNAPFFIKILAYLNSFWMFKKQIIKSLIFPKKRIWARAIMKGIGDFYKRRFGKL